MNVSKGITVTYQDSIPKKIEAMAQIGFQQDLQQKRREIHFPLINQLTQVLQQQEFTVKKEHRLRYFSYSPRYSRSNNSKIPKWLDGQIDLVASNEKYNLALEFDTTKLLRWKSIEKLFHSPAKYIVGMIYGSYQKAGITFRRNVQRIKIVAGEIKKIQMTEDIESRINEFWLILLKSKYVKQIIF